MTSVAVVGAGVIGLSTAVALQRRFPFANVTVIAEHLSPNTTGDGSAGMWEPYLLGDTPEEDIMRWAGRTYKLFYDLWKSPSAGKTGVTLIPLVCFSQEPNQELPKWKNLVMGFTAFDTNALKKYSAEHKRNYTSGYHFLTFTCEPTKFLPLLLREFKDQGGILQQYYVTSLSSLAGQYDIIVNCTGLNARHVVPDLAVHPIRGQVTRVKAPWIYHCIMDDSDNGNYVIPNYESVVMGGTRQKDWNTNVDPNDSNTIFYGCSQMVPSLKHAQIIKEWVGLRPGRHRVRLEHETQCDSKGLKYEVVHNYGHGGAGITLCWGCAEDAVDIIKNILHEKMPKAML